MSLKVHFSQVLFCTCLALIVAPALPAQESVVNDLFVDYERVLQAEDILPVHSISNQPFSFEYLSRLDTLPNHPWNNISPFSVNSIHSRQMRVKLYDPELKTYWRNLEPGGINNGAIWEGRGFTSAFSTGIFARYRFLSASVRPMIIYNQNRSFTLSRYPVQRFSSQRSNQRSEFSNPFFKIDLPQQFGNEPFWTFNPGPSYLKADFKGFEAGLSNQNRWWGPAQQYPIIMSNNAPGFWHFFAGTHEPKDIYIGHLETTFIWGKLIESDYFDQQSFNDERYITGMTMSLTPRPLPNLTFGFSRIFVRTLPPEGIPPKDLFRVFGSFTKVSQVSDQIPSGNDKFDQMISLYSRWVFPKSGFELYLEWVRNDHSWNWRDALGEPEHSSGYTAGVQKTFAFSNGNIMAVNAEIIHVEETGNAQNIRPTGSFYTHGTVLQGYTHKGQVIGSGTGPGSSSQFINGKYYFSGGKISGWVRRTVYNDDYLYNRSNGIAEQPENSGLQKYWLHNFELGIGSALVLFHNQWETEFGIELMREYNDDFLYKNDQTHVAIQFRLRYRLSNLR